MTKVSTTATPKVAHLGNPPAIPTTRASHSPADALRLILVEVSPGARPFSCDSWLPGHLVESARLALDAHDKGGAAVQQHIFNALSTAAWHVARGEPAKALARMRRAQSHIKAGMEGCAA
jgi:hypothetical protein